MPAAAVPTVVCAWCDRVLVQGNHLVSHGICQSCVRTHMPEVWAELTRESVLQ